MKDFKGTKGKWDVKHSQSKTAFNVIGTTLGGKYKIARCPYVKSPIKADEKEAHANAKLIAAAPELLSKLQKSVGFIEDAIKWYEAKGSVHQEFILEDKEFLHEVKNVISKALGKEVQS